VLVTGGGGFVGRYCCERLVADGHEVRSLDPLPPDVVVPGVTYVAGDIRDATAVRAAIAGCDRVLHLAAAHHDAGIPRETYFAVNERGTRVLCEAMTVSGITDLCFTSSVAVYGSAATPPDEDSPCHPESPYGESKLKAELVIREWVDAAPGRRALVIRPAVVFGPGNYANTYALIRQIASGLFAHVGPGRNIKSMAYVGNLVDAMLSFWARPSTTPYTTFNYVDAPDLTSREIADTIARALGRSSLPTIPLSLALLAATPFDVVSSLTGRPQRVSRARIRKLFTATTQFRADRIRAAGFAPSVSLTEGLERMVKWYRAEGATVSRPPRLPRPTVTTT
jgi:nucleoside-diphosphate-sugar epimerase